ncbi:uncharacterized protein LOC5514480 [Nematostella vectensis]|nr:uncharacterized protein LOC5514480 [Nematostella vectensis]XP_048575613.1 uncharacterized protein LOC5514480 [Nematostella vectensis]
MSGEEDLVCAVDFKSGKILYYFNPKTGEKKLVEEKIKDDQKDLENSPSPGLHGSMALQNAQNQPQKALPVESAPESLASLSTGNPSNPPQLPPVVLPAQAMGTSHSCKGRSTNCEECKRNFAESLNRINQQFLEKTLLSKTVKIFTCDHCGVNFLDKRTLNKHRLNHEFQIERELTRWKSQSKKNTVRKRAVKTTALKDFLEKVQSSRNGTDGHYGAEVVASYDGTALRIEKEETRFNQDIVSHNELRFHIERETEPSSQLENRAQNGIKHDEAGDVVITKTLGVDIQTERKPLSHSVSPQMTNESSRIDSRCLERYPVAAKKTSRGANQEFILAKTVEAILEEARREQTKPQAEALHHKAANSKESPIILNAFSLASPLTSDEMKTHNIAQNVRSNLNHIVPVFTQYSSTNTPSPPFVNTAVSTSSGASGLAGTRGPATNANFVPPVIPERPIHTEQVPSGALPSGQQDPSIACEEEGSKSPHQVPGLMSALPKHHHHSASSSRSTDDCTECNRSFQELLEKLNQSDNGPSKPKKKAKLPYLTSENNVLKNELKATVNLTKVSIPYLGNSTERSVLSEGDKHVNPDQSNQRDSTSNLVPEKIIQNKQIGQQLPRNQESKPDIGTTFNNHVIIVDDSERLPEVIEYGSKGKSGPYEVRNPSHCHFQNNECTKLTAKTLFEAETTKNATTLNENQTNVEDKGNSPKAIPDGIISNVLNKIPAPTPHSHSHDGGLITDCEECKMSFSHSLDQLSQKLLVETMNARSLIFACDLCDEKFVERRQFNKHRQLKHADTPFHCHGCDRQFTTRRALNIHFRVHTEEHYFQCEECPRKCDSEETFLMHMRLHEGSFKCPKCPMTFPRRSRLAVHVRTHSDKVFQCDQCGKSFRHSRSLARHELLHSGQRPYRCTEPECEQSFGRQDHLTDHLRTHTGERPFQCPHCSKTFRQSGVMNRHVRSAHEEGVGEEEKGVEEMEIEV